MLSRQWGKEGYLSGFYPYQSEEGIIYGLTRDPTGLLTALCIGSRDFHLMVKSMRGRQGSPR